ncbi:lipoprotein LipL71 [Leptospira ryugenii]|uniref:lipoprotein LipL71 n=1 Tax=Leptospira ryugenii TaxID=1917863 RepID=UPI003F75A529
MIRKQSAIIGLAFLLPMLWNCGQELPLKELALAKSQVERAEGLKAEEYSPDEFQEAKKSLQAANDFAAEEKASDSKKSADYAISKAYDALEKTLPKLTAKSREEAIAQLDAADEANAQETSAEDFKKAQSLKEAGEAKLSQADSSLAAYLKEEDDEKKKEEKRLLALNEYEEAYRLFEESKVAGKQAKAVAMERSDMIRKSAEEVDQSLEKASRYSNGQNPSIEEERARIRSAYADIEAGKLKSAEEKIKTARAAAPGLLASSVKDQAKARNGQARDVVEDANSRFAELKSDALTKSPNTKDAYASAQENLGAANESLASSSNSLEQEKYEDSIAQSEEAIRLAEISIDQVEGIKSSNPKMFRTREATNVEGTETKPKEDKVAKEETKASDEETGDDAGSRIRDLGNGWKEYTVGKTNPAECLWRIAKKPEVYENSKLWKRIFQANRDKIKDKDLIYPKQKLKIPPKTGKIGKAPTK